MMMKKYFLLLLFILSGFFSFGQDSVAQKKPHYVIIAGNEIVSKAKVEELGKQGYIKAINKGVTDEEKAKLVKQFGNQVGDKEFIIEVSLYTEEEKQENEINEKNEKIITKDSPQNDNEYILKVNDRAKDFSVKMIDGKSIRLSDLKGKVVLINFWATWCAPCIMEFYDFPSKIVKPFKDSNFVLLAISIGETEEKVKGKMTILKKDGINFNVGIDPSETIWKRYAKGSIPKNFLIDKKGIIRYVSTGNIEGGLDKISTMIKEFLKE